MADVKQYDAAGLDAYPEGNWVAYKDYVAKLAEMEAEIARMREREQHYARILRVSDGGQYRADWTGPLENLLRERDTLRRRVVALETNDLSSPAGEWHEVHEVADSCGGWSSVPKRAIVAEISWQPEGGYFALLRWREKFPARTFDG